MEKALTIGPFGLDKSLAFQQRLMAYRQKGRVHSGIILVGNQKEVLWKLAMGLAKSLLCNGAHPESTAYCGICSRCRRIEGEIHPDVISWRDPEEDTLKIESVREICHQMAISPIEGAAKVCIIENCHRMNAASSNAFLKSLEEPGPDRYFILLTPQVGALLPTIRSRCIQFTVQPDNEAVQALGHSEAMEKNLAEIVVDKNFGGVAGRLDNKETCVQFLQFLQLRLRDSIVSRSRGAESAHYWKDKPEEELLQLFHEVVDLEGRLRSNANYGLMLESLLRQHF